MLAVGLGGAAAAGAGGATPPYNLVIPSISGTAQAGSALTAANGTWSNTPTSYSYQWYRCSPNNLISNSGFESDTAGWTAVPGTTMTRETATVHSGSAAIEVDIPNASNQGVLSPMAAIDPTLTYHFSAWLWVPGVSKWQDSAAQKIKLASAAYDASGKQLSITPGQSDAFSGSGNSFIGPGWTQISGGVAQSFSFDAASSEKFQIYGYQFHGTIYLDDVWFNECDPIQDATAQTYTATELDVGNKLMVEVAATNSAGSGGWQSDETAVVLDSESGTPDSDQTPAAADDTVSTPAAPTPMTPAGPATPASYTTDLWSAGATETSDGVAVISSTATGTTGLTGVVIDDTTNAPIPDAAVSLEYQDCSSSCTTVTTQTTSDATGSYAFVNMPATTYDLMVAATNYGSERILNDPYSADQTYFRTDFLSSTAQADDMNGLPSSSSTDGSEAVDLPGTAFSERRVPPVVRVAMQPVYSRADAKADSSHLFCTKKPGTDPGTSPVRTFAWDYYVSHVVQPETANLHYNLTALKALAALVQNFAWFHRTLPGTYDVTDVGGGYAGQCFRVNEKVSVQGWTAALHQLVNRHRVADSAGNLMLTQYVSGAPSGWCDGPLWRGYLPAHRLAGTRASVLPVLLGESARPRSSIADNKLVSGRNPRHPRLPLHCLREKRRLEVLRRALRLRSLAHFQGHRLEPIRAQHRPVVHLHAHVEHLHAIPGQGRQPSE